jgi:hypothetical protein
MASTNTGFSIILYIMRNWLFWAGVSFIIGGIVSLALNLGATAALSSSEDLTGYALGWMIVGAVLIAIGYIKKEKSPE